MEQIQGALTNLGVSIVCGLIMILGATITMYINKAATVLKAKAEQIKNQDTRELTEKTLKSLLELVTVNVVGAQETLVKEIKDKAIDGKVNKDELKEVAVTVKENILKQVPEQSKELLKGTIGDLDLYVQAQIEKALLNLKSTNKSSWNSIDKSSTDGGTVVNTGGILVTDGEITTKVKNGDKEAIAIIGQDKIGFKFNR